MTGNDAMFPRDSEAVAVELRAIAILQTRSEGGLMRGVQALGKTVEAGAASVLGLSAQAVQSALERMFDTLLRLSARADDSEVLRRVPLQANKVAIVLTGAAGGWFGAAGILPDLAASTAMIFNSIQRIARKHGFDPQSDDVLHECLVVFAYGGPGSGDDTAGGSFLSTRLLLNGTAVSGIISRVAAEFAARLMAKLGTQSVPVLGALSGATVNFAFVSYYEAMSDVHFRLLRLLHDNPGVDIALEYEQVRAEIRQERTTRRGLLKRKGD